MLGETDQLSPGELGGEEYLLSDRWTGISGRDDLVPGVVGRCMGTRLDELERSWRSYGVAHLFEVLAVGAHAE